MRTILLVLIAVPVFAADNQANIDSGWRAKAVSAGVDRDRECQEFKPWAPPSLDCALLDAYARYQIQRSEDGRFLFVMDVASPNGGSIIKLSFVYKDGVPIGVIAKCSGPGLVTSARADGWFVVSWPKSDGEHVSLHIDPLDPFHIQTKMPEQPASVIRELLVSPAQKRSRPTRQGASKMAAGD